MISSRPRVSVIIPAYYSYETVETCLGAIRAQTFRDLEVILINSSPEEITDKIVTTRFPEVIFRQSPKRLLPHAARNYGVNIARGEILVFTDPDCKARSDWLARLVEAHDAGHSVVGGSMGLGTRHWIERGVHLSKFSWLLSGLPSGPRQVIPTANASYLRRVWDIVGPFEGNLFSGDTLLSWRAFSKGFIPWFEPRAVVEHRHAGNLCFYWHEFFERGKEFAGVRVKFEHWSRWRVAAYLILLPALLLLVLMRAGRDAFRSGWGLNFVLTLPVQMIFKLAWSLGEARTHFRLVIQKPKLKSCRRDS